MRIKRTNKKNRLKDYSSDSIIRRDFLSMKKQLTRKDAAYMTTESEEMDNLERQQHEPYRIEHEPDPRKLQEQYIKRILHETLDPLAY